MTERNAKKPSRKRKPTNRTIVNMKYPVVFRKDPRVKAFVARSGMTGYGLLFAIMEQLAVSADRRMPTDDATMREIAQTTGLTVQQVANILASAIETSVLCLDESGWIGSPVVDSLRGRRPKFGTGECLDESEDTENDDMAGQESSPNSTSFSPSPSFPPDPLYTHIPFKEIKSPNKSLLLSFFSSYSGVRVSKGRGGQSEDGRRRGPASQFEPPTVEDVEAYCRKKRFNVNASRFVCYYNATGWKVGVKGIVDWRPVVELWHIRNEEKKQTINGNSGQNKQNTYRDEYNNWAEAEHADLIARAMQTLSSPESENCN